MADYDAVVVGAGIVGASVAYHLAKRGVTRVLLVDKDGVGSGATGRSGGIARTHLGHPGLIPLARDSAKAYARFFADLGEPIGYERNGAVVLVPGAHAGAAAAIAAQQQAAGVAVEPLSLRDAAGHVPGLDLNGLSGAWFEPDAAHADAYRAATVYVDAARNMGVTLQTGVSVTGFLQEDGRVSGVVTTRGEVRAPAVVNAAGAWAGRLAELAGVSLPLRPALRRVALMVPDGEYGQERPSVYDLDTLTYWRPEGMAMLMVGGGEQELADVLHGEADPDDTPNWADEDFVMAVAEGLSRRIPRQSGAGVGGSWAGVDGTSPDLLPVLGPAPGLPGLFLACGMSGNGFKLAPAVGDALAEWVATGACTAYDLAPFAAARLAGGAAPPAYPAGLLP